jgi:hypothetical protein
MPYVIVRQHPDELTPNGEEVPRTEITGLSADELRQVATVLTVPNQLTIDAMIHDHKTGDTRYAVIKGLCTLFRKSAFQYFVNLYRIAIRQHFFK